MTLTHLYHTLLDWRERGDLIKANYNIIISYRSPW